MINYGFKWEPFSKQALNYYYNSDSFLNIAVGAIRSGKTIIALARFLKYISTSPHKNFLMAGNTLNSLKRNAIDPFTEMLDGEGIPYTLKMGSQELRIGNRLIALFGLDKEGADKKIKGYTSGGAFVDEITTMEQNAFEMLLSRNSLSGSKVFATCNPVHPLSYIYTDYVNNKKKLQAGVVSVFNFLMEDNLSLSEGYINTVKSLYDPSSVFYKRNILGQWVSGRGTIFPSFDENNILETINLGDYYDFGIGMDYGSSNMTCYSLIGYTRNDDGETEYHQIMESYYDANKEGVGQTDSERVEEILKIVDKYKLNNSHVFYPSHDAGNLETALMKDPRFPMRLELFKPDKLKSIERLNVLFYTNRLKIYRGNTETIKELRGYEWDSKKAQRGVDAPIEKDDHLIDSLRAPIMRDYEMSDYIGGLISV